MAEEKVEPREMNIRQLLPWTELFRSFQVALDPKKLLLAAGGILVMALGWWLLAIVFYSQPEPRWMSGDYDPSKVTVKEDGKTPAELALKREEIAWRNFKDDRRKWNILHAAAGTTLRYTDAGDLAESPQEYEAIKQPVENLIRNMEFRGETKLTEKIPVPGAGNEKIDKAFDLYAKPYGNLRTWPWFQDRGPNPYLLATGQAGRPWGEASHFVGWLLHDQGPVLIEPLVKFLYPVVYLLHPKTGVLNRFYFLLVMVWTLATWALFGGAITRMAAVQVARNDKISMNEAVKFVTKRYLSFLSAPLFPLLFVAFMVVLLCIYGIFFMIPWLGDIVVAGIGYPLVILAGIAMAVVLVGLVGWPMMYATISAEGSDSFDAISRSYSYVYQSPWNYLWYSLVALAYGAVVVFFIGFMGSAVVYLGKWGVSQTPFIEQANRDPAFLFVYAPTSFGWRTLLLQGSTVEGQALVENGKINMPAYAKLVGDDPNYPKGPDRMSWWNQVGAVLVTAWLYLFFLLILGFGYSYFWSASTITYLLMRRKVDDTDLDEVYLEEDEAEDSYSASTTVSAPATAAGPAPGMTMVDAPTMRAASAPPAPSAIPPTIPSPALPPSIPTSPLPLEPKLETHLDAEPQHTEAPTPAMTSDGNAPPNDGVNP